MSKNPYFAHLPTWRNRQDLAYALDNLPKALELMTASSPLLATYSCLSPSSAPLATSPSPIPRTRSTTPSSSSSPAPSPPSRTLSLPPSSMVFSPSPSSASLPYSAAYPSSSSISAPPTPQSGRSSPSFKERFMLDLTKELQHCQSPFPSSHHQENDSYSHARQRRDSGSSISSHYASGLHRQSPEQMQFMQAQRPQHQSINNINSQAPLIPHLNPTINNNTNPYYPLQFSTKAKAMAYLIEILQWLQKEPCGCDLTRGCYCGQDGVEDHLGKSPCYVCGEWYPDRKDSHTITLEAQEDHGHIFAHSQQQHQEKHRNGRAWHEQGSLRHHVAESRVKKWLDAVWRPPLTPATSPEQENVRQFGRMAPLSFASVATENLRPRSPTSPRPMNDGTSELDQSDTRSWTFHDIEMEARRKSRSRQNSTQRYQAGAFLEGYSQPPSPSIATFVANEPNNAPTYTARTRAQSHQDSTSIPSEHHHRPPTPGAFLSFATSTSEAPVSFSGSRAMKPTRASTTPTCFVIPQEILDPNYRSPTFRIKSWTPPPSASVADMVAIKKRNLDGHGHSGEVNVQKSGRLDTTEGQDPPQDPVPVPTVASPAPAPLFQFNFTSQRFKAAVEASMVAKTVEEEEEKEGEEKEEEEEEAPVVEGRVQKTATCSDASSGLVANAAAMEEDITTKASLHHDHHHRQETVSLVVKLTLVDSSVEANEDAFIAAHSLVAAKNSEGPSLRIQKSAPMSPLTPSITGSSAPTATTSNPQSPVMATAAKSNWTSFQRLMVKMSKSDMALSRSGFVQLD